MINRQNWQDVKGFLAFHEGTLQNDLQSIHRMRGALRHLLEWANENTLGSVRTLEPTFPAYLAKKKTEAGKAFTSSGSEKTLAIARQFFTFAQSEWNTRYKNISHSWISTLIPSKRNSSQSRIKEHKHFEIADILKIAALPAETLEAKRDIAAVCFLFLSGMRIAAFTSLPIECVDLANGDIYQLPEKGVMTKNRKAAKTTLLQVPELLEVVTAWDTLIRSKLSPSDLWFPVLARGKDEFIGGKKACINRGSNFGERLKVICERAGVPYLSAHKIRHGHTVYAFKNAKEPADFKAISQNLMHSTMQITDSIYGNFSSDDVKRAISGIGKAAPVEADNGQAAPAAFDLQSLLALLANPEIQQAIAKVTKGAKPTTQTKKGK